MTSPATPASPARVGAWDVSFQDFRRAKNLENPSLLSKIGQLSLLLRSVACQELHVQPRPGRSGCPFSRFSAAEKFSAQTNIPSGMLVWAYHPKLRPVAVAVVAIAVVVAVEAVDKWESYSWCGASPAFAPTQPLPLARLCRCCLVVDRICMPNRL